MPVDRHTQQWRAVLAALREAQGALATIKLLEASPQEVDVVADLQDLQAAVQELAR